MREWDTYNILRTPEDLQEVDEYLMDGDTPKFDLIAVDTETNGLNFWEKVVVGFSFSVDNKRGFYVPLLDWEPDPRSFKQRKVDKTLYDCFMEGEFVDAWEEGRYPEDVTPSQYKVPEFIKFCLSRWFANGKSQLIMHNAPFDCLMIRSNFGVDLAEHLFVDTLLLKHALDENSSKGLKETAILWQDYLGIDVAGGADKEKKELGTSIIRNGGKKSSIWRGRPNILGKYACADTFLTYAIFEVAMHQISTKWSDAQYNWFFEEEVMPLCREVVIPMRWEGVEINVPYFTKLAEETAKKLESLEDSIISQINPMLTDFNIGKGLNDAVSKKSLILKIMEMENLEHPTKITKGEVKQSLAKDAIKKAYNENPHWLWGYLLGEDELKYSDAKIRQIKQSLYEKEIGRRYHFNIKADAHLRWLFFTKCKEVIDDYPVTDSGLASMKAENLKKYFQKDYPWIKDLLLFKKHAKLYSTYIMPALKLNNNGRLHMNMNQAGTISGRFSCSGGFNLQTLPAVEELDKCPSCGKPTLDVTYSIELLADAKCTDDSCGYEKEDILCPSAIKKGFIPPEDYVIMNADYSSLEPRCFAYMSNDQGLKDVYQKNLDLYSKVYIDTEEPNGPYSADPKDPNFLKKLAPEKRTMVKPGVLGVPYGSGAWQLAKIMNFKKTVLDKNTNTMIDVVDSRRGQEWINKYLGTYKNLQKYMLQQDIESVTKGYVETIVGRRRHFKYTKPVYDLLAAAGMSIDDFMGMKRELLATTEVNTWLSQDNLNKISKLCGFNLKDKKGNWRHWDFVRAMFKNELNNSKNFPIQGLGAHITNKAMLDMQREFKANGVKAIVILQIHDEITCYVHKDHTAQALPIMKRCMEANKYAKMIDVPMIADPLIAQTLKEAK